MSQTVKIAAEPFDVALVLRYTKSKDVASYKSLIELGAKAGDPLAQYAMATWFLHGAKDIGIERNVRKAVPLLTRAARTLNRAMYDLAICKLNGAGTKRDLRGAHSLFLKASQFGSIPALYALAYCLREGVGTRANERQARHLEARARRIEKQCAIIRRRSTSWPR